jgi:hypothetical protein
MPGSDVTLTLSSDEALVLYGWLNRFNQSQPAFEDQAEQRVLWDIECILEKEVDALFGGNYRELLLEARERVRDRD